LASSGLLPAGDNQLARYFALEHIPTAFGISHVCWAPIADFHLSDNEAHPEILPFLTQAEKLGEKLWSTALVAADELVNACRMAG